MVTSRVIRFFCGKANTLGVVKVDGQDAPSVQSTEEMAGRFSAELMTFLPQWRDRLSEDPSCLADLEHEVHRAFDRGADLLLAGLLAVVMKQPALEEAAQKTRADYRFPLERGRPRTMQVRLLGGLLIWVTSLYCGPRGNWRGRPLERIPGLHIELSQFGIGKGCSPALQSRVARQAALCPSLEFAQRELARSGVKLDVKAVRRITQQCGNGLLALRTEELLLWREGQLPAGSELKGKRVTVQIDGGRTKIRGPLQGAVCEAEKTDEEGLPLEDAPGRSKSRPKRTFQADWREPKLMTIFVHDEHGRMEKDSQATVDGTFLGPDAMAELVAMHLHRLGAAQAVSITFAADGASWIWDRIPTIVQWAKLEGVAVYEVLDCCHAVHHIALALAAMGQTREERLPFYREHRTLLRNGQWRRVVEELTELAELAPVDGQVHTEIAYLQKHGEAGRLKYPYFRSLGLPIGSGAIESSIRRVINLRLKGNGVFWREQNAEAMLQVRAQVITDRWDERLTAMRRHLLRDGRLHRTWEPRPMSTKVEGASPTDS
jgi:hypothetical protein